MKTEIKRLVLSHISSGRPSHRIGQEIWRCGDHTVHVRYRSRPKSKGTVFSYNINPNTLRADFEVWICADPEKYYLFPIRVMKEIYGDPDTYVDYQHPEIRVAEVDVSSHRVLFGRHGKSIDGTQYFRAVLGG